MTETTPEPTLPEPSLPEPTLTGSRVLVVEDEALVSLSVEQWLRELDCEVIGVATSVEEGLQFAEALEFDIAVLDVNLSGQLCFSIVDALARRGIPFVFATGYASGDLPEAFHNAPMVQKPFDKYGLAKVLRSALPRVPRRSNDDG